MKLGDREMVAASVDEAGAVVQRWATIIEIDRKDRLVHLLCDDGTVTARRLPRRRRR
ncbi:MAG TPA: hypothetical protein VHW66_19000 [Stellaceae bacterium]|jgi:hypothetical protein|nr:hypothetical protein [Stellaceae bacterium]